MAGLPANVGTGTITGNLIIGEQLDTAEMDGTPAEGTVTFTPSAKKLINVAANAIIYPKPVVVPLVAGVFTTQLIATNDPDIMPADWTWEISFQVEGVSDLPYHIPVLEGVTQNLVAISPLPAGNGIFYFQGPQGDPGPAGADGADGIDGINGTDGANGADGAVGPQGPPGAGAALTMPPMEIVKGKYCPTLPYHVAYVTNAVGGNSINSDVMAYPFSIGRSINIDTLSVEVTSANANPEHLALYSAAADGLIGTKIWEQLNFDGSSLGVKTLTAALNGLVGTYWFLSMRGAGPLNYKGFSIPAANSNVADTPFAANVNTVYHVGSGFSAGGAFPATWALTTYNPVSRSPIAVALHVTAVN